MSIMSRLTRILLLLATLAVGGASVSCSITMPQPQAVQRVEVSRAASTVPVTPPKKEVEVYLLANNLHSGVAMPMDWLVECGYRPPAALGKQHKYLNFSWGDRVAYVQERWLNPWEVFHAFVLSSPAVMEVIPFDWKVQDVFPTQRIYKKSVPWDRGYAVANFLNASSRFDAAHNPQIIGPSSWGSGYLVDSEYRYYFPRICNIWTAHALEACGVEVRMWGAITADRLIDQAVEKGGFVQIAEPRKKS